jgi:hypothetical protein
MPLQRFRDFDEARFALWGEREGTDLTTRIRSLWAFAARLAPGRAPRGLRKFRTFEEAERHREEWVAARVRDLRRSRTP